VADLPTVLAALAPDLVVYLITFSIVGSAWASHQRMLGQITRGDGLLVWYTLLSLLPITLLAPCAAVLADFPTQLETIAVFAGDAVAIPITSYWLWRHASTHGLIAPTLDPRVVDGIGRRQLAIAVLFALSIPLALVHPALSYLTWLGVFGLVFTTEWLSWQQAVRTIEATIPLEGATRAAVRLVHRGARLRIDALGDPDALIEGVFGGGMESSVVRTDGEAKVRILQRRLASLMSPRYPWAWGRAVTPDWDLGITNRIPVSLSVEVAGGIGDLDLFDLQLSKLELRASASMVEVSLPSAAGHTEMVIDSRSALVKVRVPDGVAAWIRSFKVEPEQMVDLERFPAIGDGSGYRSPGYHEASNRVEIRGTTAAGEIAVA
jgi:uncharacterized membrane protein